jgi:hypothetical protein
MRVSGRLNRLVSQLLPSAVLALATATAAITAETATPTASTTPTTPPAETSGSNPVLDYFKDWFTRATETQDEQPRWATPVVTVTPRLEQEVRYDQLWESIPGGHQITSYGGGKGVELIPAKPIEVIIGIPAWQTENTHPEKSGWADETFLLKYRILSANADNGDYILTAFFGLSVPNGSTTWTSHHFMYTPTIAFGKGWGRFDFQSTLGITIPDNGAVKTGNGTPIASKPPSNTTSEGSSGRKWKLTIPTGQTANTTTLTSFFSPRGSFWGGSRSTKGSA